MQPLYEYVCHIKGHRNSKGELAEWVIKSHETGEILSSHKSEKKAKEHLQQMHIFNEAADGGQHEDFHTLINRCATATASLINKFLEKYELSIKVVDTEEGKDFFEETGGIAVRLASLQDDVHVAPVAINEELISRYYYDEWDEDNTILNECVSDTLWHEACHHICLYISDMLDVDIMANDSEEDIVENYALYMTSKTIGIHKEFSADLVDKFSGAFAILDAMNNGAFDKESLKEMMKFLYPSVDSENALVDILEDIGLTESDSKSNSKSYKLLGESTYGTDMDKRVQIFMEGVSQLGLSKNQVDAIGKITNTCMESATFGNTEDDDNDNPENDYNPENGEYDNPENGEYNPENDTPANDYNPENDETSGDEDNAEYAHELTMDEMYDKLIEQGVSKQTINIVTDIIGWNPDSMLKILDAATGYKSFDQLPEF